MLIKPLIERLRDTIGTYFSNRVDGAADYDNALKNSDLLIPSMFVVYAGSTATTLSRGATYEVELDERVKIIVIINNTLDRTGKNAQNTLHSVRASLFTSLLNYSYNADAHNLEYVGDRMLGIDGARYIHEFEFKQVSRLSNEDGAQLTLDNFDKYYADWNLPESDEENHPDAQDELTDIYTS